MTSNRHVYFGSGTADEMCFSILTMYPTDAVKSRGIDVDVNEMYDYVYLCRSEIGWEGISWTVQLEIVED